MGLLIGVGDIVDALFRSGAIFANQIKADVRRKMALVEAAEAQRQQAGYLTDADVTRLRDHLLRGGRSELQSSFRMWVSIGLLLAALYGCAGG